MRVSTLAVFAALASSALAACKHVSPDIECQDNGTCNRFPDGQCLVYAPTGRQWCSYPDAECTSGRRWSDLDVGDGLEDMCMEADTIVDAGTDGSVLDGPLGAVTVIVMPDPVQVGEADTTELTVALSGAPAVPVLVTLTSSDGDVVSTSPEALLFTDADWDEPQPVVLSAPDDADAVDGAATLTFASSDLDEPTIVDVTVLDDDELAIAVAPTELDIGEGASAAFGVQLTADPGQPVTVTAASANTAVATVAAPPTVTFTSANWDMPQEITVNGIADANTSDDTTVVNFTSPAAEPTSADVTVVDDDVLGIDPRNTTLGTINEGAATAFTVRLTQQPPAAVVVAVTSSDSGAASALPTSLTFTTADWNDPQTVTVTAPQDVDVGDESVTITLGANGLSDRVVSVAVDDNDTQTIVVDPTSLAIAENGSTTLDVHLAFAPAASLALSVSSLNSAVATPGVATLTFTPANYNIDQPVAISAPDDLNAVVGNTSIRLESVTAGLLKDVAVAVSDDDTLLLQTSAPSVTVAEMSTTTVGVRLTAQPTGTVTVNVASSSTAKATVSPASVSFGTGDWNVYKNITVTGVTDVNTGNETATITVSSTGLPNATVGVQVNDDDVLAFEVSPSSVTLIEYSSVAVTVQLSNEPPGSITGTVTLSESPHASLSVSSVTFSTANWNQPKTITVTSIPDADFQDDSNAILRIHDGTGTAIDGTATVSNDDKTVVAGWNFLGSVFTPSANTMYAFEFFPDVATTVDFLNFYAAATTGNAKLALYSSSGGTPSTRLTQTGSFSIPGVNVSLDVPNVDLSTYPAGTGFFFAIITDGNVQLLRQFDNANTCTRSLSFNSAFPGTFGAATCSSTDAFSLYASTFY